MCGITGVISQNKIDTLSYYQAHLKLRHRGPDDEGFFCFGDDLNALAKGDDTVADYSQLSHINDVGQAKVILGHRRLSILDLSAAGHQPMVFKDLTMVFNGEIFNYIELREELTQCGYSFKSDTDSEVFLKAFHHWGEQAFNHFNGMWAAAIYNHHDKELTLTRDRYGIKPLFYYFDGKTFYFGSEIKFVASFIDQPVLNQEVAFDYLRYCHLDHSNETFIKGVFSVSPGCYLVYAHQSVQENSYYQLKPNCDSSLKSLLFDSLKLRMRSDVEVGALLSGGIDSTSIVCLLKELSLADHLKTFTVDFEKECFSERKYVEKTLEKTGYEGDFVKVESAMMHDALLDALWTRESPFRSMSVILQYLLFQHIKESSHVKVILSGEGADEVFTGYTNDLYAYLIVLLKALKIKRFIHELRCISARTGNNQLDIMKRLMLSMIGEQLDKTNLRVKRGFKRNLHGKRYAKSKFKGIKNKLYRGLNFSALQEYLNDNDRNSMRFSIESRVPFLDYRIVSRAFGYKSDGYIVDGVAKIPLRNITESFIPNEVAQRKDKMGFISPQELWQKKDFRKVIDKSFVELHSKQPLSFLDYDEIKQMYNEYQTGQFNDWAFIWRVFCLHQYLNVWELRS